MRPTSLVDVLPAAAASLGLPLAEDVDALGDFSHVVVLLVDGLGSRNLAGHLDVAPHLAGGDEIRSVFPSTTPAGLGALGTALPPGVHGLVSAVFVDPDSGEVISPLHWRTEPNPIAYQPHATVFERLERAGVPVSSIGPGEYASSGLTRAVLRGGRYLPASDRPERVAHVAHVARDRGLTYLYWPNLDRTGHVHGWESEQWLDALADVERLVAEVRDAIPASAGLIVTADHGMIDAQTRVELDDDPLLVADVRALCGEPRARFVYADPGAADDVVHRWRSRLDGLARVYGSTEFAQLYGEIDPDISDRLPDAIAVANDGVVLASERVDDIVSSLIGQHGGTSDAESLIPLVVV